MNKRILLLIGVLLVAPNLAFAQTEISTPTNIECDSNFRVYVDKTSAVANNSDLITFNIKFKQNPREGGCMGGGPFMDYIEIAASGTGNTFSRFILIIISTYKICIV